MYDILGFDPKTLSNEELFSKQVELARRKTQAARLGRADIISQLDVLLSSLEFERHERVLLDRHSLSSTSPIMIETDPAMREEQIAQEEIAAPKINPSNRPIRRPVRTARPVISNDGV